MKNLISYIKESVNDITPFYKKIADFKDGENIILCWLDEDGYAQPMNVIVKKHGNDVVFVNPDDDRDMIDWKDFINSTDDSFREEKNPSVAVAKDIKQAKEICKFYNNIKDM